MEKIPICPQLLVWRQMYSTLEEAYQKAGAHGMPPPPPVFNMQAWELSSNLQKQQRWAATQAWAREYGFDDLLSGLAPEDYYDGD